MQKRQAWTPAATQGGKGNEHQAYPRAAITETRQQQSTSERRLGSERSAARGVGAQKLAKGLRSSCGVVWHLCKVHRVKPKFHRSRKAPKAETKKKEDGDEKGKCSKRKAPEAIERSAKKKASKTSSVERPYVHGRKMEAERSWDAKAWQVLLDKKKRQESH